MPSKNFLTEKNRLNVAVLSLATKNYSAKISGTEQSKVDAAAGF
jgi:hypothetical protein